MTCCGAIRRSKEKLKSGSPLYRYLRPIPCTEPRGRCLITGSQGDTQGHWCVPIAKKLAGSLRPHKPTYPTAALPGSKRAQGRPVGTGKHTLDPGGLGSIFHAEISGLAGRRGKGHLSPPTIPLIPSCVWQKGLTVTKIGGNCCTAEEQRE